MTDNPYQSYQFNEQKQTKEREYFSGANVKVYFGDVWVDQLADISFSLEEQVAPIYGFRSYTYDRIARGQRYVQGEFTLNFTENGYLQNILERIASGMEGSGQVSQHSNSAPYVAQGAPERTIQDLLEMRSPDAYQGQIDALKHSFWGSQVHSNLTPSPAKKEQDVFYYAERSGETNPLREHGFNVLIDYSPDANNRDFLDCLDGTKDGKSFFQSFRTLIGVHLMGESQVIANNGKVLQQSFRFIARDLDGDLTRASLATNFRNTTPTTIEWARTLSGSAPGGNNNSPNAHYTQT